MDDLASALADGNRDTLMLGGGNPALIPEVNAVWRRQMEKLVAEPGRLERLLSIYDPPRGGPKFLSTLAKYLNRRFGWGVGPENLAVTAGGQNAAFFILNSFAGHSKSGPHSKAILPIVPEYIGYSQQILGSGAFVGNAPKIEITGAHSFKYRIDFENLTVGSDAGIICVSRPTNPSGNVLTDEEIEKLRQLAREAKIPLLVDNAYGEPFPGIVFREINPVWGEEMILMMSLSKLGLPNTRTGLVVAAPHITERIASMTAVAGLSNGTFGQAIMEPLLASGEIDEIVANQVRPFYRRKAKQARKWVEGFFPTNQPYFIHESEGALFLWAWFPELSCSAQELYERLKERGVVVVPGHHFAFGMPQIEEHASKCLRISFSMADEVVREGLRRIGEVLAES